MRHPAVLALALCAPLGVRSTMADEEPLPDPPILISAPRQDVWAALTTAAGLAALEGGQATVDLRPGGSIRRHADAKAPADAAGWRTWPVLAYVAPRLLVLGGDTPAGWTSVELDALDRLRTRVRIEHVGGPTGSTERVRMEADDAAFVARLRRRFPSRPDPVVTALMPLIGSWEERSEEGGPVLAWWTIEVGRGDELYGRSEGRARKPASASLERKEASDGSVDRWIFWREAESGRWIGGRVGGGASELDPYEGGGIGITDRRGELGALTYSIERPAADEEIAVERIEGCIGVGFRWRRAGSAK